MISGLPVVVRSAHGIVPPVSLGLGAGLTWCAL